MRSPFLAILVTLFGLSAAQDGLPDCAKSCVTQFTSSTGIGGCSALDIHCICSSANFLNGIACCLAGACSAADQSAAVTYAKNICKTANPPVTVPDSVVCTSTTTSGAAAATTSSTSNSSASNTASPATITTGSSSSSSASASAAASASASKNAAVHNSGSSGIFAGGLVAALALL